MALNFLWLLYFCCLESHFFLDDSYRSYPCFTWI